MNCRSARKCHSFIINFLVVTFPRTTCISKLNDKVSSAGSLLDKELANNAMYFLKEK